MISKNKYDPFKVLQTLQDNINRLFEKSSYRQMNMTGYADGGNWKPVVDVFENQKEYIIDVELSGLTDKDFGIKVDNNILTLSGERKFPIEIKEECYHRFERVYGSFKRDFTLSNNVDVDKIEAELKDGILTIIVPKSKDSVSKKISIVSR